MATKIKPNERLFCRLVADGYSPQDAASRAELSNPKHTADRLMHRTDIRECIRSFLKEDALCSASAGYRRIAFGSIADAVRLCLGRCADKDIEQLDLFCVQELKCTDKGVEVKFFDRIKALERLGELTDVNSDSALPFYRALEQGARALAGESDDV